MTAPAAPIANTPHYLAVDGGGTKTLAVVVDASGRERGRGLAASSNQRAVGLDRAVSHLRAAVEQATGQTSCAPPLAAAWFGLAGVDRPDDVARLMPHLAPIARDIRVTNDAELVLGGLEGGAGVALIAGTGSIALGRDAAGRVVRAGGWGHLLGDEGSGYDIGRRALQAATRMADGRAARTPLLDAILAQWGLAAPGDLIERVYRQPDKARVAGLANLVLRHAREGDPAARAIARAAADELSHAALAVARALDLPPGGLSLALGGGLLVHVASLRQAVLRRIRRAQPVGRVTVVAEPALAATRALALDQSRVGSTAEPDAT